MALVGRVSGAGGPGLLLILRDWLLPNRRALAALTQISLCLRLGSVMMQTVSRFRMLIRFPIRFLHQVFELLVDYLVLLLRLTRLRTIIAVHASPIRVWIVGFLYTVVQVVSVFFLKGNKLVLRVFYILGDGLHRLSVLVVRARVRRIPA